MALTVGVLGGTGPAGRGVAVRLAAGGANVVIGSRDAARANDIASTLSGGRGTISGADNLGAASCEVVVVATPWDSAVETVTALRDALSHKVVVSMVNALIRHGRELVPLIPARGSMAAEIAAALPTSDVTGAFHHLPAAQMEDLDSGLDADVLVVGDGAAARKTTLELIAMMPGLRGVEVGSLALAGAVESFTAACITVNIRHKAHSYVRLAGLGE